MMNLSGIKVASNWWKVVVAKGIILNQVNGGAQAGQSVPIILGTMAQNLGFGVEWSRVVVPEARSRGELKQVI